MSDMSATPRDIEVGLRVTAELVEARTVLRRAKTAVRTLGYVAKRQEANPDSYYGTPDPDAAAIAADLEAIVKLLTKYERTGKWKRP